MSDKFSVFLKHQIDNVNLHLPKKPLTLKQVGMLKTPGVKLRDGTFQDFDPSELKYVRSLISEDNWHRIQLPIIITRRRDFGNGAYTIGGDIGNLYIILSIFEDDLAPFEIWKYNIPDRKVFYRPHISKIRNQLNTLSCIAFT